MVSSCKRLNFLRVVRPTRFELVTCAADQMTDAIIAATRKAPTPMSMIDEGYARFFAYMNLFVGSMTLSRIYVNFTLL